MISSKPVSFPTSGQTAQKKIYDSGFHRADSGLNIHDNGAIR